MPEIRLGLLFITTIPIAAPAMNELKQNQIIVRALQSIYLGVRIRSEYTVSGRKNAMTATPNQDAMIIIGLNHMGTVVNLCFCGDKIKPFLSEWFDK
jgi:hypothetical protein